MQSSLVLNPGDLVVDRFRLSKKQKEYPWNVFFEAEDEKNGEGVW